MNRYPLFILVAALLPLSPALAAPAPAPTPTPSEAALSSVPTALQRCDRAIADAETMSIKITECSNLLAGERVAMQSDAKPNNSVPRGLPDVRFNALPAEIKTPNDKELLHLAAPSSLLEKISEYFAYKAYAAGDPSLCKRLAVLDYESNCRQSYVQLKEMKAMMGDTAGLLDTCRAPENRSPAKCCSLIAKATNRAQSCSLLVPGCMPDMGTCKAFWGRAEGDAKACQGIPVVENESCKSSGCAKDRAAAVARCESEATFARAFKAGDINQCGGNGLCLTLMGKGNEAAAEIDKKFLQNPGGAWFTKNGWTPPPLPVETAPTQTLPPARKPTGDFKGFVCAEPLQSADNRKVADNIIAVAKTCLSDIETALGNPSKTMTEGIEAREERIARLSVKMDQAFALSGPKTAPKPTAPARPAPKR